MNIHNLLISTVVALSLASCGGSSANSDVVVEKCDVSSIDSSFINGDKWGCGTVLPLSESDFALLVNDCMSGSLRYDVDRPCVIDFYATWCGPCKKLSPKLDRMASKYRGKVQFFKVDVDACPNLANAYNIRSIPTVFYCKKGKDIFWMRGLASQADLDRLVEDLLK